MGLYATALSAAWIAVIAFLLTPFEWTSLETLLAGNIELLGWGLILGPFLANALISAGPANPSSRA
jgi:hypothetical protein